MMTKRATELMTKIALGAQNLKPSPKAPAAPPPAPPAPAAAAPAPAATAAPSPAQGVPPAAGPAAGGAAAAVPPNMPPAGAAMMQQQAMNDPNAALAQQAEQAKIKAQAEGHKATIATSATKAEEAKAKAQEAQKKLEVLKQQQAMNAQMSQAGAGAPKLASDGITAKRLLTKIASQRRVQKMARIATSPAFRRLNAATTKIANAVDSARREVMLGVSAINNATIRSLPATYVKEGARLDSLTDTSPWLVGWCLGTKAGGYVAKIVNDRLHQRVQRVKVAAGDTTAYAAVIRDGMKMHNSIMKVSALIHDTFAKFAASHQSTDTVMAVKLAVAHIMNGNLLPTARLEIVADAALRKSACTKATAPVRKRKNLRSDLVAMIPVQNAEKAASFISGILSNPELAADNEASVNMVLRKYPDLRASVQAELFNKAGAAALVANDTDTLAKCVFGLAGLGALGDDAQAVVAEALS